MAPLVAAAARHSICRSTGDAYNQTTQRTLAPGGTSNMESEQAQNQQRPGRASSRTGRPSIREEQKMRTRDRLLDAAFEVFKEVGFRVATIDEIMKRAGANRATFYLHFTDKLDIAAGLGRRSGGAVAERYRLLDNLVSPTKADIRAWLEHELGERRKDQVLLHVIQEAVTSDPRFGQEYVDYFGRIAERVMVNTIGRWPAELRPLVRAKMLALCVMMDRLQFHLDCQDLAFGENDAMAAMADIFWNELFGCSLSAAIASA
jgi:AcrR family transcriptional regulator